MSRKKLLVSWQKLILIGAVLIVMSISGCQINPNVIQDGLISEDSSDTKALTYPYGVKAAYGESWSYLVREYNEWKAN